jgi:hypothetical protein
MTRLPTRIVPQLNHAGAGSASRLVPEHLSISFEHGLTERPVTPEEQAEWGLDPHELLHLAVAELQRLTHLEDRHQVADHGQGFDAYLAGDGHSAARMLVVKSLYPEWPMGGVVAACPTADQLLLLPLYDHASLYALDLFARTVHEATQEQDRPLSDQLYWHDGRRWHHVGLLHGIDSLEIDPPTSFATMMGRLALLGAAPSAAA